MDRTPTARTPYRRLAALLAASALGDQLGDGLTQRRGADRLDQVMLKAGLLRGQRCGGRQKDGSRQSGDRTTGKA